MTPARAASLVLAPLSALALVLALAVPAAAAPQGSAAVDAAWTAAMKANDLDAVVACYADDATAWFPHGPRLEGKAAIRAAFAEWLGANTITEAAITPVRTETSGKLSVAWGQFMLTMTPKAGGGPITLRGHYSEVAVKQGNRWVYLLDHATEDAPPPAAAPATTPTH